MASQGKYNNVAANESYAMTPDQRLRASLVSRTWSVPQRECSNLVSSEGVGMTPDNQEPRASLVSRTWSNLVATETFEALSDEEVEEMTLDNPRARASLVPRVVSSASPLFIDHEGISLWTRHLEELELDGITDLFSHYENYLSKDSGFSDIPNLLYPAKYLFAVVIIVCGVATSSTIIMEDVYLLRQRTNSMDEKFLMTKSIGNMFMPEDYIVRTDRLVPACELLCLAVLLLRVLKKIVVFWISPCLQLDYRLEGSLRWGSLADLFFELLPWLVNFSALKLLYWVTPAILSTEAYNSFVYVSEKFNKGGSHRVQALLFIFWYIFSRLLCLIFGFDAFLVKFRTVDIHVDAANLSVYSVVCCLVFVVQVLGIVGVKVLIQERLFHFIFAGEDGDLTVQEDALKDVWCALFVKQVYEQLGFVKGTVAMLSFDDYDYQRLVLDPKRKHHEIKRKLAQAALKSQRLRKGVSFHL